jgi:diaminohydroxyphosphoribosylaminopyrimidine deaminase / 5-amino-6-(5-phosphoribosylamino)uracil reductase
MAVDDQRYMIQAIRLARRGEGRVEPNPMVGAVIVKSGRVIGRGWHKRFGGAHAEVNALAEAGKAARGATMYVTLEPCVHFGKTPPCADAVRAAGIRRVVIGVRDPYKTAAGGAAKLRRAGVQVQLGVCEVEARRLIEPYAKHITTGLPWVIGKWAATLDGALAAGGADAGALRWISNERSRRLVHRWRGGMDAVMVGIGTVLADDPQLTARQGRVRRIARRVVVDPALRMPTDCKLVRTLEQAPLTVAVRKDVLANESRKLARLRRLGVEFVGLSSGGGRALKLRPLLRHLGRAHSATNVMVEGGPGLLRSLFRQKLVDEARVFVAPKWAGRGLGFSTMQKAKARVAGSGTSGEILMQLIGIKRVGDDVLLNYRVG